MARIRTIKPEFFTSEDIVSMSPLARIFYIGLWCEADREGRLEWKPGTFKMRYLPGDACDIKALAGELVDRGLLDLYEVDGKTYGAIPTFSKHQVINNRESESVLPDASGTRASRVKAEGKGREGEDTHTPLARDWTLSKTLGDAAIEANPHWTPEVVRTIGSEFADHHRAAGTTSADWSATWRKWCADPLTHKSHPKPAPERSPRAPPGKPDTFAVTVPSDGAERTQAYLVERTAKVGTPPPPELLARLRRPPQEQPA